MIKFIPILSLLLVTESSFGESFVKGDVVAPLSLSDQHGKSFALTEDVKWILYSRQRSVSAKVNKFLSSKATDFLEKHHAVYLADISPMPKLITEWFALPKMQKFSYRMMLDREGIATGNFPVQADHITVLQVERFKIEEISFHKQTTQLAQFINEKE